MESVFDAPLSTVEFEDSLGGSLSGRQAGDSVNRFGGVLVVPEMSYVPADTKHLTHVGEFQVFVQFFIGPY